MSKKIFLDLDGTLVRKPQYDISPADLQALKELRMAGFEVFACTGRSIEEVEYLSRVSDFEFDGIIGLNGMYYRYDVEELSYIDDQTVGEVIAKLDSCQISYEAQAHRMRVFSDQRFLSEWLPFAMGATLKVGVEDEKIAKIVIRKVLNDLSMDQIISQLDQFASKLEIVKLSSTMIEITNFGVSKASHFTRFKDDLIYAVGDSYNDLTMLETADYGFLMNSASTELQAQLENRVKIVSSVAEAARSII